MVVVVVLMGAILVEAGATRNARAVTTPGVPVDFGMSVIAINVTQITAQTNDLLASNLVLEWKLSDIDDTQVPTKSGSINAGIGCSSSGTPCPHASFDLAFPANHYAALELKLWDDQPWPWGRSPVNLDGASNTWSLMFPNSRASPKTQVPQSRTGNSCNPFCKFGTVSIDVTVHGLFQYQTNNRYFWYQSWATLMDYLNQDLADYCISQLLFTPQQQKEMLATLILEGFLLAWAPIEDSLDRVIDQLMSLAWDYAMSSLRSYTADSLQVARLASLFSAQAVSCRSWTAWNDYGYGVDVNGLLVRWGTAVRNDMVWIDADLVAVNSKMWANNVPQIISALTTAATDIGNAKAHTRSMMAAMNSTCAGRDLCAQDVINTENSVLMPLLTYLTADALYTSGLVTSLTAGGSSMMMNGQRTSDLAVRGYRLPDVYVNTAYDAGLTVAYGMPPQVYSWTLVSGSPPSGTGFGYAGGCPAWDFCGRPTAAGTFNFQATLTDGAGDVVTIPFTLVVNVHTYTLTISTPTGGGTTSPGPGTYTYTEGTQVTVTALPNAGVPFRKWRLDGVDQTANPIAVTMNGPHTLAAYFGYTLTIATYGPGTTSPAAGTYYYVPGTNARVTATPNAGVTFRQWTLDGASQSANPITVTMNADHALNAYFGKKLTISKTGIGGTVPGSGTIYYADGTQVTITENTLDPYFFKWWTVDGVQNTNDPLTVTMNVDHSVVAVFGKPAGGCVAQGTMVTLADGSMRAVEKLKIGDQVLGYDPENGAFVVETIQVISSTKAGDLLNFNDGALRTTLTDQPIYVRTPSGTMWVHDPIDIQLGWEFFSPLTQQWTKVTSITHEYGKFKVYDFRTDGPRTYLANSVLVLDKPI